MGIVVCLARIVGEVYFIGGSVDLDLVDASKGKVEDLAEAVKG